MSLSPKWLIGRTIVAVDMGAHKPRGGRLTMHEPTITLDNGAKLKFHVEENPDGHYYGVDILYVPPKA